MRKNRRINRPLLRIVFFLLLPFAVFYTFYVDRVYPGVKVAGIEIGGKTKSEIVSELTNKVTVPEEIIIAPPSTTTDQSIKIPSSTINLSYDIKSTVDKAYEVGRTGNLAFDIDQIIKSLKSKINLGLEVRLNEDVVQKDISAIAAKLSVNPVYPSIEVVNGKIVISKGEKGTDIDRTKLRVDIGQHLAFLDLNPISVSTTVVDPTLNDTQIKELAARAQKLIGKKIIVNFENNQTTIADNDLVSFLSPQAGFNDEKIALKLESIKKVIERDPQNAVFQFTNGRVQEFTPGKDGVKIKEEEFKAKIVSSLQNLIATDANQIPFDPPVTRTEPKVKTSQVNNLGIKELIGVGTSRFAGSIVSRIHNIALAASKLNGILIEPGQTFSFNNALGDISMYTGYQQAYIIKDGKTVMGDGGGVCQVSTTLFRAALKAGLPIVERNAHAYRVHYYEEDMGPGYDATVYSPTLDLKFKNDTGNYILIQTHTDLNNLALTFELYGTSDGRKATISKAVISDIAPPPPDLYTDDPTLPKGVIKQVDFAAWGAKVYFNYSVERSGQTIYKQTFYSNFQPWQAKFLRGTGI